MVAYRYAGPLGILPDWLVADDGTLPRTRSPLPAGLLEEIKEAQEANARTRERVEKAAALARIVRRRAIAPAGPCQFVNPVNRGTVSVPRAVYDRLRRTAGPASVSEPVTKDAQVWWQNGPSFAALEQTIAVGGRKIRVIRPLDAEVAGKNLPTTSQIAEALRVLPADQLETTTKIFVSPVADPKSSNNKIIAGTGGAGEIIFYPLNIPQSQNDFDNRMTHESGHNYQGKFWLTAKGGEDWSDQALLDKRRPSPYAAEGSGEDFSEFIILYNATKDTPCEAICRQIYPHRWAKMEEYLKS